MPNRDAKEIEEKLKDAVKKKSKDDPEALEDPP